MAYLKYFFSPRIERTLDLIYQVGRNQSTAISVLGIFISALGLATLLTRRIKGSDILESSIISLQL